jgi:hypothetical protein
MKRLAWGLCALWLGVTAVTVALAVGDEDRFGLIIAPALAGFAVVGALIASRHQGNAIGWLLLAFAIVFSLANAIEAYVETRSAPAPLGLWLDDWVSDIWIALVGVWIPLLFPNGRLPAGRWRPVAWFGTAAFATGILAKACGDRMLDTSVPRTVPNPYALPGAAGDLLAALAVPAQVAYAPAALGAMVALVARLRHARGVERQQLKWFAYVGALTLFALLLAAVSLADPERLGDTVGAVGWFSFLMLVLVGLPVAIGTSILRHRLFDIDVVINRTLVYGALTATLGATYIGSVLLLGLALGQSNVAIAISTLAVAALFRPARARIQAAVDRRFYRRRYDAARTLEAFSARLRDEVDLEAVGRAMRAAVHDTVQPAHLSLWLPLEPRNDFRTDGP